MDAPQVWKICNLVARPEDKILDLTSVTLCGGICNQGIDLVDR